MGQTRQHVLHHRTKLTILCTYTVQRCHIGAGHTYAMAIRLLDQSHPTSERIMGTPCNLSLGENAASRTSVQATWATYSMYLCDSMWCVSNVLLTMSLQVQVGTGVQGCLRQDVSGISDVVVCNSHVNVCTPCSSLGRIGPPIATATLWANVPIGGFGQAPFPERLWARVGAASGRDHA